MWVKDTDIPEVSSVPVLVNVVKYSGNVGGVAFVHVIIEGTGVSVLNYMTEGVDHNLFFVAAEDEHNR